MAQEASTEAANVLKGNAPSQQITYGATLTPQAPEQLVDTTGKTVTGTVGVPTPAQATVATAPAAPTGTAATAATAASAPAVTQAAEATKTVTGTVTAPMTAATQVPTNTDVTKAPSAAQIATPTTVVKPTELKSTSSMLVSGAADAATAAAFAEDVKAAEAQPTADATVQGQLAKLMADFDNGNTPAWAAGAMREATAVMAQRGLSASSMAGQALIQAAMESALPIAAQDAQTKANFEMTNLSNRQARAMLAAQQRAEFIGMEFTQEFQARVQNAATVADIAKTNFTAEQQIALENANIAATVDLNNLSNQQARVMAEVAQIASLEQANLNNRQQAAVQNAQAFLEMDMTNLNNKQQTELFKSQNIIQSLFNDTAAENANNQFNATSQNQVDQFFKNLATQVNQFNATQSNAISQFNADQTNVIERFNAEIQNQRDQFNAQNRLVIDQANATWFRQVATADTAAINYANQQSVSNLLAYSTVALNNMYQAERDAMEQAWASGEGDLERSTEVAIAKINADAELAKADATEDAASSSAIGGFVSDVIGLL